MAHVTMAGLNTMNRILKLYKFAYGLIFSYNLFLNILFILYPKEIPGHTVAFAGYPASLASQDDFTITSARLVCFLIKKF